MKKKLLRLLLASLAVVSALSFEVRKAEAACFSVCEPSETGEEICCRGCCGRPGGGIICSEPSCS